MQTLFFLFSFFLSFLPNQLASSISIRRILHEPFHPLDSLPPSQHPILPSSTTIPLQPPPFFPFYPSPPPPPPPPPFSTFVSFPANISSLLIPHSFQPKKTSSHKLLHIVIIIIILIIVSVSAFVCYCRRKRYTSVNNNKTVRTESSPSFGLFSQNAETETINRSERLTHTVPNNSNFLFLETVINSHRVDIDDGDSSANCSRKMESPELQPLPRLALRQHYSQPTQAVEEFFSPKALSMGASECSSQNGLSSWRILPEQSVELSSNSCSSNSVSPNLSPKRSELKSCEETRSLASTSLISTPERNQVLSPSSEKKNDTILVDNDNTVPNGSRKSQTPSNSSAFSLPSSPEKAMNCDSFNQSPRISSFSSFSDPYRVSGLSSVPLSPTLVSSPERELSHAWNVSEKFTNCVLQRKQHWEIPVFSVPTCPSHRLSLSLPSQFPRRKQWQVPAVSGPVNQASRPPELTPPSRPFVLLKPTQKVSSVE